MRVTESFAYTYGDRAINLSMALTPKWRSAWHIPAALNLKEDRKLNLPAHDEWQENLRGDM